MTPRELSQLGDLLARNRLLEQENKRLRALVKTSCTKRRRSEDEARFWHGVAIAHGAGNRRFERAA